MRHQCDKLGCHLAGEDEEGGGEGESIAPAPAATIAVSGPSLVYCPACRRPARELLMSADGRVWCSRCPALTP
jgi:hypothetical protein